MIAALFSREVSQALIAVGTAITGIGVPLITWISHRNRQETQEIKVFVNGQITAMMERVNEIAARVENSLPGEPPTP